MASRSPSRVYGMSGKTTTGEILHNDHYAAERFCCLSPRPHARNPCAQQLCKRHPSKSHLPVRILHAQPASAVSVAFFREHWKAGHWGKRASKSSVSCCLPRTVMYITDSAAYTELESATRRQGGRWSGLSSRIVFLLTRPSFAIRRCAGTAVCEVDPLDLVETIREGVLVLDPDRTDRFAHRSFGEFTSRDTPRDKEGWQ
jgi:hypothetical protein